MLPPRSLPLFTLAAFGFAATQLPVARAADPVSITKAADALEIKVNGKVVSRYHVGEKVAKPYLYPILAPNGAAVTRGWPMDPPKPGETTDHPHQKSAWFCHGDVIPEGIELKTKSANKGDRGVDFWADPDSSKGRLKPGEIAPTGKIVVTGVSEPKQVSSNHAMFETKNDWITPDGVKIMDEVRNIHVITLPKGVLYVFDIDLHAGVCPITFGDTKEGSFGVRVNDTIRLENDKGGVITTSNGDTSKAKFKGTIPLWGKVADWNDYSGTIDGKSAGVAVFADPKNPIPTAWHTRTYGLLAANPFARDKSGFPSMKGKTDLVKIPKGDHLKLRYAIYAHDGDTTDGQVAQAYEAFKK